VKALIALLPKQIEQASPIDEMPDDQLDHIVEQLLAKYGDPRQRAGESAAAPGLDKQKAQAMNSRATTRTDKS
jgi:hypothetical protein